MIEGATGRWEIVIGLEVHAQLKTRTKIFCDCKTDYGDDPNSNICPVCLGHPGVLPVLNENVVRMAVMAGLALHCSIEPRCVFSRKQYFYPDLPKGYQISQFDLPICARGWLDIHTEGEARRIPIERAHLEEDAGKNVHDDFRGVSQVDFNRTGVPLLEIVSGPDLTSPEEAMDYLRELRNTLRYIGVCDGNLEEGSFRCDANISLKPKGAKELGTRVEIKNLNSFRNVGRALTYEIRRQARVLEQGGEVSMHTALFDADQGTTSPMRSKEDSSDYRYFPDPDLLPVVLQPEYVENLRQSLPETPEIVRARFTDEYGLRPYDVGVLTDDRDLALFYEATVKTGADPTTTSNWIQSELLGRLANDKISIGQAPVPAESLGRLLAHLGSGKITGKMAKEIFANMWTSGADPDAEVERIGGVVDDDDEIRALCQVILKRHASEADEFRGGKTKVLGFLMGKVMQESRGKANPKKASAILREELNRPAPS